MSIEWRLLRGPGTVQCLPKPAPHSPRRSRSRHPGFFCLRFLRSCLCCADAKRGNSDPGKAVSGVVTGGSGRPAFHILPCQHVADLAGKLVEGEGLAQEIAA